jgi:hypothetical protein
MARAAVAGETSEDGGLSARERRGGCERDLEVGEGEQESSSRTRAQQAFRSPPTLNRRTKCSLPALPCTCRQPTLVVNATALAHHHESFALPLLTLARRAALIRHPRWRSSPGARVKAGDAPPPVSYVCFMFWGACVLSIACRHLTSRTACFTAACPPPAPRHSRACALPPLVSRRGEHAAGLRGLINTQSRESVLRYAPRLHSCVPSVLTSIASPRPTTLRASSTPPRSTARTSRRRSTSPSTPRRTRARRARTSRPRPRACTRTPARARPSRTSRRPARPARSMARKASASSP